MLKKYRKHYKTIPLSYMGLNVKIWKTVVAIINNNENNFMDFYRTLIQIFFLNKEHKDIFFVLLFVFFSFFCLFLFFVFIFFSFSLFLFFFLFIVVLFKIHLDHAFFILYLLFTFFYSFLKKVVHIQWNFLTKFYASRW